MKIYTSYWAQVRNFPQNLIGLNTTIWPPKWRPLGQDKRGVICINCPPLQPGHECEGLCNGKCIIKHPYDCQFLHTYYKQLEKIDINNFLSHLENIKKKFLAEYPQFQDVDFALIFFEKYDNPCSERWPVQKWFRAHGIEVTEWHEKIIMNG